MSKNRKWSLGLTLVLSVLFSLIFYAFNTPLGPSIGSDNAMYLTMGTAIANGYAPYTEIFDHKGPLLYILQAIPQMISGGYSTLAVFIQQAVFLFICLFLAQHAAEKMGVPALAVQAVYLALICTQIGGGNLTEEYTNVFTFIGILIMLRFFENGLPLEEQKMFIPAAVLGAMAALCFLVRANNALVLCAMTLMLAVFLALFGRWKTLAQCAGGFLAGVLAAALPVIIWLLAHGALEEAVYGSLIHNMMYADTDGGSRLQMLLHSQYGHLAILMAALSCLGALTMLKRSVSLAFAMVAGAAAAGLAAFISHKFYQHYLILGAPLAAVGAACVLRCIVRHKKKLGFLSSALVIAISMLWIGKNAIDTNAWRISEREGMEQFVQQAQELYAMVPQEDHDSFMAYRAEPKWYVAARALPCMRFYFLQEILASADPAIMDEIVSEFETDPPKWLVIYYNREFGPPYDERVNKIFEEKYEFVDSRGTYQLRKLKETL